MKEYKITVYIQLAVPYTVKAESLEEALQIIDDAPLPELNSSMYVNESAEFDAQFSDNTVDGTPIDPDTFYEAYNNSGVSMDCV